MRRKPFACWNPRRGCWEAAQGTTLWELKPGGKWTKLGRIFPVADDLGRAPKLLRREAGR